MGKIKAALAGVSTEFKLIDPGVYRLEVKKVTEVDKNGATAGYRINSEVVQAPSGLEEMVGRTLSDYVNIRAKDGGFSEPGLANLKRYYEVTHGQDTVASWSDEDYDDDLLIGKQWDGQIAIESYTPQGESEPRQVNRVKRMEQVK